MKNNIFTGLITAMITPFKDNKLDCDALKKIVNYQIDNGVEAIVIAGSTGEGYSLMIDEYREILSIVSQIAQNHIKIISGCCELTTRDTLDIIDICNKFPIDGIMCSIPPYVKPTQEGIYLHFAAIHDATNLPIMLYSVPTRTAVDFADDTIIQLSKLPKIIALKDAGTDLERPLRIKAIVGSDFNLLSGNDEIALAYNAHGGVGCVSVASNIAPNLCKKLQDSCQNNDYQQALKIQQELFPLYKALFAQGNPIPLKYAAYKLGLCDNKLRLPLTPTNKATEEKIDKVIDNYARI